MGVYLLLGDDEERKLRSAEKLRKDRQAETFSASDASPETVVTACNSFSLFGDSTFVVVRDLDSWNAAQKARILTYLKDPSEETDLVLMGRKLGSREKLLAAVNESGEVHTLDQPTGKALAKWAVGYAKKSSLALPQEVAEDLQERCSGDKARMMREIEKLSLYVGEDRPATPDDVELLCPADVQSNIFEFVDALVLGRTGRAARMLEKLAASGEPPLRTVFMVRRQFQLAARAKALIERGLPRPEVSRELKVPPFVAKKLEGQAARLDEADLEDALLQVLELERGLKGGSELADAIQVELSVVKLASAGSRG